MEYQKYTYTTLTPLNHLTHPLQVHSWGLSLLRAAPDPAALTAARHLTTAEDPAAPAAAAAAPAAAGDAASDAAAVAAAAAPAAVPWEYDAGKPKQVWPAW